jgi:hypothetical protein
VASRYVSGRARFTLDGETLEAPAGTLVFVRDPAVRREAVATEAGTEVLALGGPPTFEPAGSGWLMRARPLIEGDPGRARAILQDGLSELPDSAAVRYGFALLHAAEGDLEAAAVALSEAVAREPRLRDEATKEPWLASLVIEPPQA